MGFFGAEISPVLSKIVSKTHGVTARNTGRVGMFRSLIAETLCIESRTFHAFLYIYRYHNIYIYIYAHRVNDFYDFYPRNPPKTESQPFDSKVLLLAQAPFKMLHGFEIHPSK